MSPWLREAFRPGVASTSGAVRRARGGVLLKRPRAEFETYESRRNDGNSSTSAGTSTPSRSRRSGTACGTSTRPRSRSFRRQLPSGARFARRRRSPAPLRALSDRSLPGSWRARMRLEAPGRVRWPTCRALRGRRRVPGPDSKSPFPRKRTSRMGHPRSAQTRTATGLEPLEMDNGPFSRPRR